jgi:hypothetical protein
LSPARGVLPPCVYRTGGTHKEGVFLFAVGCLLCVVVVGYCVEGLSFSGLVACIRDSSGSSWISYPHRVVYVTVVMFCSIPTFAILCLSADSVMSP